MGFQIFEAGMGASGEDIRKHSGIPLEVFFKLMNTFRRKNALKMCIFRVFLYIAFSD